MLISPPPDLDLAAIRMLTLVADLGSISAAARAERISQPSASRRIQVLERQLGLELLERRTRGAVLTEHGRLVTAWCRTVVAATDALTTGSSALSEAAAEQLGIAASQTIAEYLCPSWLSEFRRGTHPPVRLHVANSQGVIAAVRSRAVHLGVPPAAPPPPGADPPGDVREGLGCQPAVAVALDDDICRWRVGLGGRLDCRCGGSRLLSQHGRSAQ